MYGRVEMRQMKITNLSGTNLFVNAKKVEDGNQLRFSLMPEDFNSITCFVGSESYEFEIEDDRTHVEVIATPWDVQCVEVLMPSAYFFLGVQWMFAIACIALAYQFIRQLGRTSPEI